MEATIATSFIEFSGYGFWAPDHILEVWLYRVYELLGQAQDDLLDEYRDHIRIQATAGMNGCIDMQLNDLNERSRGALSWYAQEIVRRVRTEPALLSGMELNALKLGGGQKSFGDVPVEQVEALSRTIVALLRGELGWAAGDREALPDSWLFQRRNPP